MNCDGLLVAFMLIDSTSLESVDVLDAFCVVIVRLLS